MTHIELVNLALSIHGSVLLATIVAYFKYGERTELIDRGLRGTNGVFTEMRRRIVTELAEILNSFFQSRQTAPTISDDQEPVYLERLTNPVQSEGFRECVREYIEGNSVLIADYRSLLNARDHWCNWARFLAGLFTTFTCGAHNCWHSWTYGQASWSSSSRLVYKMVLATGKCTGFLRSAITSNYAP